LYKTIIKITALQISCTLTKRLPSDNRNYPDISVTREYVFSLDEPDRVLIAHLQDAGDEDGGADVDVVKRVLGHLRVKLRQNLVPGLVSQGDVLVPARTCTQNPIRKVMYM